MTIDTVIDRLRGGTHTLDDAFALSDALRAGQVAKVEVLAPQESISALGPQPSDDVVRATLMRRMAESLMPYIEFSTTSARGVTTHTATLRVAARTLDPSEVERVGPRKRGA